MAEYFQSRKSDAPEYYVPTEYPKHVYGGRPVQTDADMKAALANGTIKTREVRSAADEAALIAKGWVLNLQDLVKEPTLPGAVRNNIAIPTGVHDAEDFTALEETAGGPANDLEQPEAKRGPGRPRAIR